MAVLYLKQIYKRISNAKELCRHCYCLTSSYNHKQILIHAQLMAQLFYRMGCIEKYSHLVK